MTASTGAKESGSIHPVEEADDQAKVVVDPSLLNSVRVSLSSASEVFSLKRVEAKTWGRITKLGVPETDARSPEPTVKEDVVFPMMSTTRPD